MLQRDRARRAWQPLPPACASRCSSCARWESMGIAMATYCGQNYGAGKTERINMGLRARLFHGLPLLHLLFHRVASFRPPHHLLFVDVHEYEIIEKANQFIVTSCTYFIPLDCCALLRYSIQGLGYSKLAMMSGVFGNGRPHGRQPAPGPYFRIYGSLLRRPLRLGLLQTSSSSRLTFTCINACPRKRCYVQAS